MRRVLLMGIAFALLVLNGQSLFAQGENSQPLPATSILQLVDSDPLPGEELSLNDSLTLYFDRPLDCTTAATAFAIQPPVSGSLACDGTRITFTPDAALERASTYLVQFDSSLRAADGSRLFDGLRYQVDTVGYLQVSETFPAAGSVGIEPDTQITVIFNQPVVPLVINEEQADLLDPLRFDPPLAGTGEWVNTSIYTFTPDAFLQAGTAYNVTIASGLTAQNESVLPQDYTFSFQTQPPAIVEFSPNIDQPGIALDAPVTITFNQAMNRASVESAFSLRDATGATVSGSFEWNEDDTALRFQPQDSLALGMRYNVTVEPQVQAASGGMPGLQGQNNWSFTTVSAPAIIGTEPENGASAPPFRGFVLEFASPMDQDTLADKITIEPAPEYEPRYYYREWSDGYEVSFQPYPSTEYTVTIAPGMQDVYGNAITEPYQFSFTTQPFEPEVSLRVPGSLGFYNAYREPTQLFVTYRNIDSFDLALYDIPFERFAGFSLNPNNYFYDLPNQFAPQDTPRRTWTIDGTVVPENALRYDLLDLDTNFSGANCEAGLPSRLMVGDQALVITEPDPIRARSAPVDGEVVELLYRDYALTLVDGPICGEDGLIWWQVQLRDDQLAWVAESLSDEYLIAPRQPDGVADVVVADENGESLPPGIYYLALSAGQVRNQGHMLVVGTANLVVKNTLDTVTVWATDVQSGQPLADVPINIYDQTQDVVASGRTDADGLMNASVPPSTDLFYRRMAVLDDGTNFGIGFSEWTEGIEPYHFGQNANFYPSPYRIYVYTDRPVYRPGQPVYFRGVVRAQDDMAYTPATISPTVTIRDNQGNLILEQQPALSPYGTFDLQLDLADDAPLGFYRIEVAMPGRSQYDRPIGSVNFNVAEYRLPEFQVELTPQEPAVVQGDTIQVTVDSTYFFGGAVSNATVDYNVIAETYFFEYEGAGYYSFTDTSIDSGASAFYAGSNNGAIASGSAVTDAQGEFVIEVPADLGDAGQSQTYIIEAVVRDESDQAVAGRAPVIVHQGLVYLGARPSSYVSFAGQTATVELVSVDWDSQTVGNQPVEIEVVERRWSSVQERDAFGRTVWTWDVEEIPVTEGSVTTAGDGNATFDFVPPRGGVYKVYATTRDERDNEVRTSDYLWVADREYVSWRQQNSNRIDLIADGDSYAVGDTAEILITSPFQGTAEALVTVERGDVLRTERVTMDSNSYLYQLPIEEAFAPNIYVSVLIVKGVDENNPVVAFRMGYLQLSVDPERRQLDIAVEADVDQASPQQTISYTLRTTDWQGNPVPAEVGVAVTDLASLSIAQANQTDIFSYFFSEQSLSVRTSTPLTINTDQITQEVLDTVKGGGGGGGADGLIEIRGEFIDTPYWNASVITDASGEATIEVRLPDNLTTWRLDARAVTLAADGNMLAGEETFDLLSTRPIIVRPVTPRFFVVGDEVVLAAVINNNTDSDQDTVVTINASGVTLADDAMQRVTVPAGGRARVTWRATVQDVEAAQMTFTADAGAYSDGSISPVSLDDDGTLPIYRYEAPETVGTAGVLRSADTRVETIYLPQRMEVTEGTLAVTVDHSLAAAALDSLDYLEQYPYYCTEQTVSRFLPNIMTVRALQSVGLSDPMLESSLSTNVNRALQKLYAEQHADGGWGWFVRYNSNSLVTAYALIGLAEAQAQGFVVPDRVISNAQNYLANGFNKISAGRPFYVMNEQVMMLYALARSGQPDIGRTAAIYEYREDLSIYARALLAETFYLINPVDTTRSDVLLNDILSRATTSAAGVYWTEPQIDYWNWNTDTRTTSIVLGALTKLRPNSDIIPNVVRYLMVQRRADSWENTQETAWAVMALTDWMVVSGELQPDYAYDLSFNDETRASSAVSPATVRDRTTLFVDVSEMLRDEANRLTFTRSGSPQGNLYYTAYLTVDLPVPQIEPLSSGLTISRSYSVTTPQGDDQRVTEARVGDVIEVRLTIVVPEDTHYVQVTDPLPAGAEGIDPNLTTNQQIGTRPGLDNADPLRYGWGWWWFGQIEFRDESVVLYADYLPAGTYEYVYTMRASVEGTYNVIPPTAHAFYFPDIYGRGAGSQFTVLPAVD